MSHDNVSNSEGANITSGMYTTSGYNCPKCGFWVSGGIHLCTAKHEWPQMTYVQVAPELTKAISDLQVTIHEMNRTMTEILKLLKGE